MQAEDDDVYNAVSALEEEKEYSRSQRRRSSIKNTKRNILSLAPNLGLLLLFYVCFYSFLCGFYLLLLKGVTSTPVGGQETLLWTFFYLGVTFIFMVSVATYASQWEEKTQTDASSSRSIKRSSLSSLGESESRALMNEPPPPPPASDGGLRGSTITDDDLDDVELVSDEVTKSSTIGDSKHIGDVDVS